MSVLRDAFLTMSTHPLSRKLVVGFPLSRRVARRFVAGETLDHAIARVQELNAQGLVVALDHLGESVTSAEEARRAKDEYLSALDAIAAHHLLAHVSLKLTQMGLDIDPELCLDNLRQIIARAQRVGTMTWIDMEDSSRTQKTLNMYKTLREEFTNLAIAIQSYLYRSEQDMRELCAMGAFVRLCKGAYKEPPTVAFPKKKDVDANYIKLAEICLSTPPRTNGGPGARLALATHDEKIIHWAKQYIREHHVPYDRFEFQMLYGIRSDLQRKLAAEGYTMRVYVPYGSHWYPYFMRRLAERPANVIFLISNLFK